MAGSAQKPVKAKAKGKTSKESKVSSSSKTPKKKKPNVTALQLEEMQPRPKEYSNADLRKLKAQAIARRKANLHNGYGQLLVVDENESQSWIAGYLGFHDINVLRSFMALEEVKTPLDEFLEMRKANFGIANKSGRDAKIISLNTEHFYQTLSAADPASEEFKALTKEDFHTDGSRYAGGVAGRSLQHMNYAIACIKLLNIGHNESNSIHPFPQFARAEYMPRIVRDMLNDEDEDQGLRFFGYRWEDWNRALTLVKWHIRNTESSRTKSASENSRQTSAKKAIAQIPAYLTEEDLTIDHLGVVDPDRWLDKDDDSPEERAKKERYRFREACMQFCNAVAETNRNVDVRRVLDTELKVLSSEDYRRDTKVLEDALAKLGTSSENQKRKKGTSSVPSRPALIPGENLKYMTDVVGTVIEVWSEKDIINQRNEYAKASLDARGHIKKRRRNRKGKGKGKGKAPAGDDEDEQSDNSSHSSSSGESDSDTQSELGELHMNDMVDLSRRQMGELSYDTKDIEDEKTESAWKMREELGKQGRELPMYKESCAWAVLDPEDLTIPTAQHQKGKEPLKYKPHQVIAAHDMARAESQPWHAVISGLACGLGKTLTALLATKIQVDRQKAHQDAGNEVTFAATLIECPAASVEVWMADLDLFMPGVFKVWQFYGTPTTVTNIHRVKNLVNPPTIDRLNEILSELDPKDPQTGYTLIITGHTTWYTRTLGTLPRREVDHEFNARQALEKETITALYTNEEAENVINVLDDAIADVDREEKEKYKNDNISLEESMDEEHVADRERLRDERLAQINKLREEKGERAIRLQKFQDLDNQRVYCSRCMYMFARVIVDEAHILRNPDTLFAEAVFQTQKRTVVFLTATPMLNHPKDLRGYLHQIFKNWRLNEVLFRESRLQAYATELDPRAAYLKDAAGTTKLYDLMPEKDDPDYSEMDRYDVKTLHDSWDKKKLRLWILDPRLYKATGKSYEWNPEVCRIMLPPILAMLLIRIDYSSKFDLQNGKPPIRVGDEIPRCEIYTVELAMNGPEKALHDRLTLHLVDKLGSGKDDTDQHGRVAETAAIVQEVENPNDKGESSNVHHGVYRFLKHCTFDPRLGMLTEMNHKGMTKDQKTMAAKSRRNNWTGIDFDHGATFFFEQTKDSYAYLPPETRIVLANYMAAYSVKLKYAFKGIAENIGKGEKTILIYEFPMPLWYTETQLENLGIEYVSIKSSQTQEERTTRINRFNDPESDIWVLLVTNALGSISINLQGGSSCIYVLELPIAFYILMQIMGRINRIGQKRIQRIYIPWVHHSYDQCCWHRIARKIIPSLAGEGAASKADDPQVAAETLLQRFLGMPYYHRPYHRSWATAPYDEMHQQAAVFRDGGEEELNVQKPATDPENGPVTNPRLGWEKTSISILQKTSVPTQNVATTSEVITPVKRKHDKVPDEDEFDFYIPESDEMQKDLARLEDCRRLGWADKKTKASEKLRKDYGKLFKQLQGQGVVLTKGTTPPGDHYQECMLDWRKPYAGCSWALRHKLQRDNGDEESSSSDAGSSHPSPASPPRKRAKRHSSEHKSSQYVHESDADSDSNQLSILASEDFQEPEGDEEPAGDESEESNEDQVQTDDDADMVQ